MYIWKSLIPTTIRNIIGGGLFVAAADWYLYLTEEGAVEVDFNLGSLDIAMEVGGLMGRISRQKVSVQNSGAVIEGKDPHSSPSQSIILLIRDLRWRMPWGKELSGEKHGDKKPGSETSQA